MSYLSNINDCPLWFLILVVLLVPILYLATKKSVISVLIPYVLLIIGETLIFRTVSAEPRFQFELFWSYKIWSYYWFEIIANIIVFIPLGILLCKLFGWKGVIFAILFSSGIEIIQLVSRRGLFEFDDIFNNSLGSIIGGVTTMLIKKRVKKNN